MIQTSFGASYFQILIIYLEWHNFNVPSQSAYSQFQQFQMRSDKYKLSQPPRLKSVPRSLLSAEIKQSDDSSRSNTVQCDPIFLNKNKNAFDQTSFRTKYQRALDLISKNKETQSRTALNILQFLCCEIHRLPQNNDLGYELLETVVLNCWRLKNSFKDSEPKKQQSLNFIRSYVQFFTQTYKKNQIHKNGLHNLYFIQANEQFDEKLFSDALKSCEMSIRYCSGIKNQAHLLKVQYLKFTIHNALNNNREELESIKRCLFFINSLMATTNQQNLKENINLLKKNLVSREVSLKGNPNHQKSLETGKKTSFSLFRKKSFSHKKHDSQKQIVAQKKIESNQLKVSITKKPLMKSIHTRSANNSKYIAGNRQQKATFLPTDITKFSKTDQKLKKKPLKITQKSRINNFQDSRSNIMDEIQQMRAPTINYELLMVRRPNELKKQSLKKSNKTVEPEELPSEEVSIQEMMAKKESLKEQEEKIEPVTHYISKVMHTGNDEIVQQEHQELVRQCVKLSEQTLLKTFFKKITLQQENQFNDKVIINVSNHPSRVDSPPSSSNNPSNQFEQNDEQQPQLNLNRSETNNHYEFFQPQVNQDSNFSINQNLQLIISTGILSKFKFSIKIQKKEHLDQSEQFYNELYIKFSVILNKLHNLHSTLAFRYYNPFEKNLEIILDQICKNQLDYIYNSGESIKYKLLNLMSNRLLVIKKPNGMSLSQKYQQLLKKDNIINSYTEFLRNRFIIYEENKLTNFVKNKKQPQINYFTKKNKEDAIRLKKEEHPIKDKKEELNEFHQILNFYLPKLIRRMTDDLKEEKSSLSSVKRMKTQRFYKDTILSYKSLIKSLNESDMNTRVMFDDQKSLSIVMPSDFNSKISNFFEHEQGVKETSIYQFYYCMKFILIQPAKSQKNQLLVRPIAPKYKRRRITIDKMIKDNDKQVQFGKPKYLEDTLKNFYDFLEIEYLFHLKNKMQAHIKMTCFKVKEVFKKTEQYFYKFEMQFNRQKIKMMKFIATSYDIYLLITRRTYQLKSSRKKQKPIKQDYEIPAFNQLSLLFLLKQISQKIFVKKDYIYSIIGIETPNSHFNYINKFKLQGKAVQNKQFMIPHLKYIHILLQKSIKIICDHFKQYAVLTIRQIERSIEFNVIFYIPKNQRTYSINLSRKIIDYLQPEHKTILFDGQPHLKNQELLNILFKNYGDTSTKPLQTKLWNNFSKLFKFQVHYYEDKMHMLVKIGTYMAFLKDSCFSEFFELKDKIFHLQMSLAKKSNLNSSEFELKHVRNVHPKRKSASSKELIKRNNFLIAKDMKSSGRVIKPSIRKKCSYNEELFKKGDIFQKLSNIYENDTNKYIIYVSLTKIYEISNDQVEEEKQTRKINLSFYLSDMINLLKLSKKELYTKEEKIYNEFNEQIFSFSILLRSMTIIKYKLINQLKNFKEIDQIFQGENTISIQKRFKNNLIKAFCSQNQNLYSLNSSKKLYKLQNNIYLINKNLINSKKNMIVSIFYDEKGKKITFYLTNTNDLVNKQRSYGIKEMKFPWIEFYEKQQLFKISKRMYNYYKNVLLFM